MKVTGGRLLGQILGYDFISYGHTWYRKRTIPSRKRWSKLLRIRLKNNLLKDLY